MAKVIVCRTTSAAGIMSLLHDDEPPQLHEFAIRKLNDIVDDFWYEIADSISLIELCADAKKFKERRMASLLASKLHYHLGSYDSALKYALGSEELFFSSGNLQYMHTIINECIEYYKIIRQCDDNVIDPRLESIVNKAFNKCLQQQQYGTAIGLALETRRMDVLENAILHCGDPLFILEHTFKVTVNLLQNRTLRNSTLQCLVDIYNTLQVPDFFNMCKCLVYLEDHKEIARMLGNLLKRNDDNVLIAYQIGFDLYENVKRKLLWKIMNELRIVDFENVEDARVFKYRMRELFFILRGDVTTELYLHFLFSYNHTDRYILENMKNVTRDSICHSAIVFANALMNYGTTSDKFIIDNVEWWCQESNWAEFSATAGLGVINKGNEEDSVATMSSYFPGGVHSEGIYTEAGFFYGLGLIHANHGEMIIDYIVEQLKHAKNFEIIHGCCLGIGLAALGTNRQDIYKLLRNKLHQNEAIIGESAGIAIGLVGMGSKSSAELKEMMDYARDTKHDKIIRGLAIGIALQMFECLDECEALVSTLWNNKEPLLRCAAMHTLAMAYSATGDSKVVQRLLAAAVSDPSDDVKRAAIQALGFIFLKDSEKCVAAVSLLSDSYNSHARYGAALALGISCAGTGNEEALSLLWDLTDDIENLVVQGALVASAIILIQHTPYTCSKLEMFQELYQEIIEDRNEHEITKFGAILAQGIINGGGRNVTISLKSRAEQTRMGAVGGMFVFTQYWYWFPLIHFVSLTFLPTCLIGVNAKLRMPKMEFTSNSKPSHFGYPPVIKRRIKSRDSGLITFILSFATRVRKASSQQLSVESEDKSETTETEENEETEPEPDFEILLNPGRVTANQLKYVYIPEKSRYESVRKISKGGIIMMRDKQNDIFERLVEPVIIEARNDDSSEYSSSEDSELASYI